MSILVRAAVPEDAAAIAAVRVHSWRAAYAGVIPSEVLDAMDPAQSERLRARLADPANPFTTRVAERDGALAGYTITGPYRREDVAPGTGEVLAIYAHPDHWSTGVGRALMIDALDKLSDAGLRPVLLWVLRDNPRARRFYERAGFAPDGAEHSTPPVGSRSPRSDTAVTIVRTDGSPGRGGP